MNHLNLLDVIHRTSPPVPWTEGDCIPWNDPDFSVRMLREHLSQDHNLASRTLPIIDEHVAWLHDALMRRRAGRVLDLGCGPGLYLHRLAQRGHRGVGIDFSPASVAHARRVAGDQGLDLRFVECDVREADFGKGFDLVTMIFGQFNVFRRDDARRILERAHDALHPGGHMVVEPQTSRAVQGDPTSSRSWTSAESGLFSDAPHLVLHERFWDEESKCCTERWYVVDAASGAVTRHAQSSEAYSEEELAELFTVSGFSKVEFMEALPGTSESGSLFAVVATS